MPTEIRPPQAPPGARILFGVFGCVFAGAGLCMLALIWGGESDFVPVPARLFGSLICLAFLAGGGFMVFGAIASGRMMSPRLDLPAILNDAPAAAPTTTAAGYHCPHCGAALSEKADVSPLGDAKCPFCGQWFNVHGNHGNRGKNP